MFCELKDLHTESDVEQKLIYQLLTAASPKGPGYSASEVRTKERIAKLFTIGKGRSLTRGYIPDYIVLLAGVPVLVVEAKAPDEDLDEGFREARMYANELNGSFEQGTNPCRWVIATNGKTLFAGHADVITPKHELQFAEISTTCNLYTKLLADISKAANLPHAVRQRAAAAAVVAVRPLDRIGGDSEQGRQVERNPIGSFVTGSYQHIFNPRTRPDRARIVKDAYVPSQQREEFASEIDMLIRSAASERQHKHELLQDTGDPKEILSTLEMGREQLVGEFMFLIGSKGCGKSTFVDYLREVKLPPAFGDLSVWVRLDMFDAPKEETRLEQWIIEQLVQELRDEHSDIDVDDRVTLEKIFGSKLASLRGTELYGLDSDSKEYRQIVSRHLEEWRSDSLTWLKALVRYFCDDRNKLLILVYDNSDKRDRHVQLRMFEAAHWIMSQIKCFVIFAIRDVTFETYSSEPPLDAIQKHFKYYLDPPLFSEVLKKRLRLVLDDMDSKFGKGAFVGPMGATVTFSSSDVRAYVDAMYTALFEHNRVISGIMFGLAGRDVRQAIVMFMDFCKSSYIPGHELFSIRAKSGKHHMDEAMVINALMRGTARYFREEHSVVKNLFQLCHDALPDHFIRWSILAWLAARYDVEGPSGSPGFHRWLELQQDLIDCGHDSDASETQCRFLIEAGLLESEHQEPVLRSDRDLLRITPSGRVHLELISNETYLGACAEDTKLRSRPIAERISARLGKSDERKHVPAEVTSLNSWDLLEYLLRSQAEFYATVGRPPKTMPLPVNAGALKRIRDELYSDPAATKENSCRQWRHDGWADRLGVTATGIVEGIAAAGVFVRLTDGPTGLVPRQLVERDAQCRQLKVGESVSVKIEGVDSAKGRATLTARGSIPRRDWPLSGVV